MAIMTVQINGKEVKVSSVVEARQLFRADIAARDIGASKLKSDDGEVKVFGKKTATISFNGRAWNLDGSEIVA